MFAFEAIKTIKNSGTIAPSSKFLVKKMIKPISKRDRVIIEFGTGNGCITKGILNKMHPKARLFSFELNEQFSLDAQEKMGADKRLHIINGSAVEFDKILETYGIHQVDQIISSLPLTLLDDKDVYKLLRKAKDALKPGGLFVQFQYSLDKYDTLKMYFSQVKLGFVAINIPPAFIYYCKP